MERVLIFTLFLSLFQSCIGQDQIINKNLALELDRFIYQQIEKNKIPSLAVGVVKNGKIVISTGFGYANIEEESLANENTIYQLGSVSKMFTGHVLAKLIHQKELSMSDNISTFFPKDIRFPKSPTGQRITIKHIATHSSEFPRYPYNLERIDPNPIKGYTREQMLKGIENISIDTLIGYRYNYSNFGYGVLGTAMENLKGQRFSDLMKEIIFSKYEMNSSSLELTDYIKEDLATPYLAVSPYEKTEPWNMESLAAAGNVFSSIADLNKFMIELLTPNDINKIQQKSYFKINDSWNYGLGCFIVESKKRNTTVVYHGGDIDGYASSLSLYPSYDLGIVILTNWGEGQVIGEAFDGIYEIVLDHYLGPIQEN